MVGGAVFLESDTATTVLGPKVQEKWGQAAAQQQSLSWQELGAHGRLRDKEGAGLLQPRTEVVGGDLTASSTALLVVGRCNIVMI